MKVFEKKIIILIISITSVIAAPRYPRYKRSDDATLSNLQVEAKFDQNKIDSETSTSKSQTTTSFDKAKLSHSRLKETSDPTTLSGSESNINQNVGGKDQVSKNIETMPSGLEIYGVENRFICFLKVANGKRICKPLNFFIILNKNNFDCQDRNIVIAFRGYNIELEDTDEFIEGFLNREQGEIDGNQIRERDCYFYKK